MLVKVILDIIQFQGGDVHQLLLHGVHAVLRHLHYLLFGVHVYEFRFEHFEQVGEVDVVVDVLTHVPERVHGEVQGLLFN